MVSKKKFKGYRFICKALTKGVIHAVSEAGMKICEVPQICVQPNKSPAPICQNCKTEMVYDGQQIWRK